MTIHLGFNQYESLRDLYDNGSPVTLVAIEEIPEGSNAIVDLNVTYFVNETETVTEVLTKDGWFEDERDHNETMPGEEALEDISYKFDPPESLENPDNYRGPDGVLGNDFPDKGW